MSRTYRVQYTVKLDLTQREVDNMLAYERDDAPSLTNPDTIADALYDYIEDLLGTGTLVDEEVRVSATDRP